MIHLVVLTPLGLEHLEADTELQAAELLVSSRSRGAPSAWAPGVDDAQQRTIIDLAKAIIKERE